MEKYSFIVFSHKNKKKFLRKLFKMKRKNSFYELNTKVKKETKSKKMKSCSMFDLKSIYESSISVFQTSNTTNYPTNNFTNAFDSHTTNSTDQHIQNLCHSITCLGISEEFEREKNNGENNFDFCEQNEQIIFEESSVKIVETIVLKREDYNQLVQSLENIAQIIFNLLNFLRN